MIILPTSLFKKWGSYLIHFLEQNYLQNYSPLGVRGNFYLSHQTLVSKSSAPILEIASLTLVLLTEISEFG